MYDSSMTVAMCVTVGARILRSSSRMSRNRTPFVTILKAFKIISSMMLLTSSVVASPALCPSWRRFAVVTRAESSESRDFLARRNPSLRWMMGDSRVKQWVRSYAQISDPM